jgi:predicted SnoaL-like aldol condensation-catalyzing enzyme
LTSNRKGQIRELLKSIETGDPAGVAVVNPTKYIQHNPQTREGGEGLAALFKRLSESSPRVNVVRVFEDGHYVFAHTEYDFASSKVGFEVFRFEGDLVVEHWDNIQKRRGPNRSGHSMVDGPTEVTDLALTEANRTVIRSFVNDILVERRLEKLGQYLDTARYTEHSPDAHLADTALALTYDRIHRVLAEGSFGLAVSEGANGGVHSAFYDLFRVADGKLVEHWNTIEAIPPRSVWKNDNGKF